MEKYNRWHRATNTMLRSSLLKTGAVMEHSPIGPGKWLIAMWLIVECKSRASSYEIYRSLRVTQKMAWFLDRWISPM
jgi:hypothetical protein